MANKVRSKNKLPERGDCLAASFNLAWRLHRGGATVFIVHGHVAGQGKLYGKRYRHAWVEEPRQCKLGERVYDRFLVHDHSNGNRVVLPRELYYEMAGVEETPGTLFRYTFEDAALRLLKTETYCFWELPLSEDGI